jgi:hypothetical protein
VPTNPQPQPDAEEPNHAQARVQAYLDKVRAFVKHDYACELLDEPGYFATLDHGDIRALLASLATLREERDALLADKARLDWLERDHNAKVYPSQCFGDFGVRVMHEDGIGFAESGKVRDAIDAARAAHQGTEP